MTSQNEMKKSQCCRNCYCFVPYEEAEKYHGYDGECHYLSPKVIAIGDQYESYWPPVPETQWCYQWEIGGEGEWGIQGECEGCDSENNNLGDPHVFPR